MNLCVFERFLGKDDQSVDFAITISINYINKNILNEKKKLEGVWLFSDQLYKGSI